MKVIFAHKDLKTGSAKGGICTLFYNLAKELIRLNVEITAISSWKNWNDKSIKHIYIPYYNIKDYRQRLSQVLNKIDFDLIECSSWKAEALEYVRQKSHKPVIVRGDLSVFFLNDFKEAAAEKELIQKADFRIAVSKNCAQSLEKVFKIKTDKVILNGVDLNIFKPSRKQKKLNEQINIAWIGKPTFAKGFDILNNLIIQSPKNFVFHLVLGNVLPEYRVPLIKRKNIKVYQNISSLKLVNLFNQSDVCLSTSRFEGFGLNILESMACGIPAIVPKQTPSFGEFVRDGIDGFTYRNIKDAVQFIKIAGNLNKSVIRKQAGKFSWRKTAQKTFKIYKNFIK